MKHDRTPTAARNAPSAHTKPAACAVPTAPGSVTATAGTRSATATWTAADGAGTDLIGYVVSASAGGPATAVAAGTLTAAVTGLAGGTATVVSVRAVSSCGTGPAATAAAVTPTGAAGSYAATVRADTPVAYYRLGEAPGVSIAADSATPGAVGTYGSSATLGAAGALGALDPDAGVTVDGSCCTVTATPTLPLFDSARSVEAWVKPVDSSPRWIAGWGQNDTDNSFNVGIAGAAVLVDSYNDQLSFPLSRTLTDGSWHQVVVTATGNQATAYVDGLPVGTKTFVNQLDTVNDSGLVVGAFENGGGPFYGGLDEVSVYPAVLTAAKVAAHFAATGYKRPAAPTRVTASDGADNEAVVSWAVGPATTPAISRYVITAISSGGIRSTSAVVAGTKTAARLTGLAGGASYTFSVAAGNAYGLGPATASTAAAITGSATPYAAAVAADAPAAYYRLGEPLNAALGADSSGKGNLLEYNRTTLKIDGALPTDVDTAASTDGNCCIGSAHSTLPQYDSARTVEFMVRPSDNYGRWVAGWGRSDTDLGFNVGIADGSIIVSGYGDDLNFPTGHSLVDGVYHDVALSYDGSVVKAYLDGQAVGTKAFANPLDTINDSGLVIGAGFNGAAPYYGDLDEVSVYPSALSAARIAAHFAASGHAVPAAVSGVTAAAGTNTATVNWTPPTVVNDDLTGYLVTASKAGVRMDALVAAPKATTATLTGLAGATAVTIAVTAIDAYGYGPATTAAAVTPTGTASTYPSAIAGNAPSVYYRLGEAPDLPLAANSAPSGAALQTVGSQGDFGSPGALVTDPDTAATANGSCCLGAQSATLPAYNAARTVEAWVKPTDGYGRWFLGWGDSDTDRGFNVGVQDSLILVSAYNDDLNFQAPRSLVDGSWHHVAVTYDGTSAKAYVDGVLLGTKSFVNALDTADVAAVRVGSHANGGGAYYGGLDEVAVFPTALTAAQVSAHFAASGHGVPVGVTALTATAGATAISVTWTPPASPDPLTSYVVTALKAGVAVNAVAVAPDATGATISGLPGAVAYTVRVVASNAYGNGAATVSAAATPTGGATTYASSVLANTPSAYYRLGDGTGSTVAADSSGKGHPGTYNQAALGLAGALRSDPDTAANANGSCCVAAAVSALPAQNTSRTVEAWVQPSDGYTRVFAGWGASATRQAFNVGVQDTNVIVGSYGDDLSFPVGHTLVDGLWHHVVATYNGTTVTVYVDATAIGSKAFTAALHTTVNAQLQIGSANNGGSAFYGGLDDLAIYPSALTAAQVTAHFTASGHAVPTAVTGVGAAARANALAVTWTAATAADGVTGYLLTALAGGSPRDSIVVAGTATTGTITGLVGGTAYTVRVTALDGYGAGPAVTSAAATPTGATSTYASTVQANSPSVYYRLGEPGTPTVDADSSTGGKLLYTAHGTYGVPGAIVGDLDTAVSGDGGCCLGASSAAVPTFNNARSVEAWVKPLDTYTRWFTGWGSTGTDREFSVGTGNDAVTVSAYGDDLSFPAGRSLEDGTWHYVVVTYDGTSAVAYVDGATIGTQSFHAPLNTVSSGIVRVGSAGDTGSPFYGGLDEVAIYPAALTAAQVTAHFAASGHKVPGTPTAVTATARANGVNVSWTAPAAVPDGTGEYVVTAYRGTTAVNSVAVPGGTTTAVLTGLPGGSAVTVKVSGGNNYGLGVASAASAAVTPTGSTTTYAGKILADAPVAYYRLGEPANTPAGADSSGKAGLIGYGASPVTLGGTGALPSDPDTSVDSNGGCCIGSAQVPSLPKFNSARTVEAWVKPNDNSGRWFTGWGTDNYDRVFDVGTADSSVIVAGYGDDLTFDVGHTLSDGAWHHVVVTYDGTSVKAYADNVLLGTQTFQHPLNTVTTGFLRLGAAVDGGSASYGGLDELAIYPTALTAAQISAHYAAK